MNDTYIFPYSGDRCETLVRYITTQIGYSTPYTVGHLMFIADMMHIQEYGFQICGDRYAAIKDGAVCTGAFSITMDAHNNMCDGFIVTERGILNIKPIDVDSVKESHIKAINWSIEYMNTNGDSWKDISKTDEWIRVFKSPSFENVVSFKMLDFKNSVMGLRDGINIWKHMLNI